VSAIDDADLSCVRLACPDRPNQCSLADRRSMLVRWLTVVGTAALLAACSTQPVGTAAFNPGAREPEPETSDAVVRPEDRRAFFGETHLHTSYSFDAYGFTPARTDPDLAYRFARVSWWTIWA
jgi:hypothetical protein